MTQESFELAYGAPSFEEEHTARLKITIKILPPLHELEAHKHKIICDETDAYMSTHNASGNLYTSH